MLVTPEQKDVILHHLINEYPLGEEIVFFMENKPVTLSDTAIDSVFHQFSKMNLINYDGYTTFDRSWVKLTVNIQAHDFILEGGFNGKYELFQKTVEKLLWEVEKLEREHSEGSNNFTEHRKKIAEYVGIISQAAAFAESAKNLLQ